MAVVSVEEQPGRSGTEEMGGKVKYTRTYQVVTDSRNDGPRTVRDADGIPIIGEPYDTGHESDLTAIVSNRSSKEQGTDGQTKWVWEVVVEYSEHTKGEEEKHPLQRTPEISFDFAQFSRVVERDVDGNAVTNSAGQYFDPPIEADDSRPVLTVVRNEASFNPGLAFDYRDAINSDTFYGASAGQAKVAKIAGQSQVEQFQGEEVYFWRVTYEIHFNPDGWAKQILDQGRYKRVQVDEAWVLQEIRDDDGRPLADPVPLDGSGNELDLSDAPPGTPISTAVFLTFNVFRERSFATLNLPVA